MGLDPLTNFPPADSQQALAQRLANLERQLREAASPGAYQASTFAQDTAELDVSALGQNLTAGPTVQLRVPDNGLLDIYIECDMQVDSTSGTGVVGVSVDNSAPLTANLLTSNSASWETRCSAPQSDPAYAAVGAFKPNGGSLRFTADTGLRTVTLVYFQQVNSTTARFKNRKLWVSVLA